MSDFSMTYKQTDPYKHRNGITQQTTDDGNIYVYVCMCLFPKKQKIYNIYQKHRGTKVKI